MAELATSLDALVTSTDAGKPYGITDAGFVPKPLGRLIDEKLAAARLLFGSDIDLTAGSSVRKVLEIIAVEEARCWEHLGHQAANNVVSTATGSALSALGAELGIVRPQHRARGRVSLALVEDLPAAVPELVFDRGTRLLTDGGHDVFVDVRVELTNTARDASPTVVAFDPGPEFNLDPAESPQTISRFNEWDHRTAGLRAAEATVGSTVVEITHDAPLTGGELVWSDEDYRDLLLAYPRNIWTADAVRVAVGLVPGVRQVLVKDRYGGLDIHQSIFGNFSFIERLFSEERSLGSPYFFTVMVAPGTGALWNGPGQLRERVQEAVDRVRPIGIFPNVLQATEVGVTVHADIAVEGLPIPAGTPTAINTTDEAIALKSRIITRIRRYVSGLTIASAVRHAEVVWAIMEEPGVVDCKNVRLFRHPPRIASIEFADEPDGSVATPANDADVDIGQSEVANLVEDLDPLRIV